MTADRRRRLAARLAQAGLDGLLLCDLRNVRYLSGFTGSAGRLLVTPAGEAVLATDGRYREQAGQEAPETTLLVNPPAAWPAEWLPAGGRVGVESATMPWDDVRALADALPGIAVVPAPGHVEALRALKDDDELAALRRACAIGDAAFADALTWIEPGMAERAVARRLERTMVDLGADDRAFETIVAAGPNGARPHHRAGDRPLAVGDVVTLDFGARVDGYHSDMTRVVALGPVPDGRLASAIAVVRDAQAAGVAALHDGLDVAGLDAACRDAMAAGGFGEAFVHGTGHGIGLAVHEAPIAKPGASGTLRNRMVVTVEPGAYLPGTGGVRIEDTVALLPDGRIDVLTTTPRDLVVL